MNLSTLKLCFLVQPDAQCLDKTFALVQSAIAGGVTAIQLRDKINPTPIVRSVALTLKALLKPLGIPLILNDDVALAKEIDLDGVHLGQSDCPPHLARQLLGPDKIIGWSIESEANLHFANKANQLDTLTYVAACAFATKSKQDGQTIWGLDGLAHLRKQSKHPLIAIGGINSCNLASVLATGVAGIAVISAIADHPSPQTAAQELRQNLEAFHHVI